MGQLFYDGFNRANAPLGTPWVNILGTNNVFNNQCRGTGVTTNISIVSVSPGSPDYAVEMIIKALGTGALHTWLIIRSNAAYTQAYTLRWFTSNDTNVTYVDLYKRVNSVDTRILRMDHTPDNLSDHTLKIQVTGTLILVWIDDILWIQHNDASVPGGDYAGIQLPSSNSYIDDFTAYDAYPSYLLVYPSQVPAGAPTTTLQVVGYNTGWMAGNPGSPLFTCVVGNIAGQQVIDATHALLYYNPPPYMTTDQIGDPTTGASFDLGIGQPAPGYPTDSFQPYAAVITEAGFTGDDFIRKVLDGLLPGSGTIGEALKQKVMVYLGLETYPETLDDKFNALINSWGWLIGPWNPGPPYPDETIFDVAGGARAVAEEVYASLLNMRGDPAWTLRSIRDELAGPGLATHADILDALTGVEVDLQPVLDELAAIRTNQNYTLGSIMAQLAVIQTGQGWTLWDVIDAVQSARGDGLPSIRDVLDAIEALPPPNVDLQPVLDAIAGVSDQVAALQTTADAILTDTTAISAGVSALQTAVSTVQTTVNNIAAAVSAGFAAVSADLSALSAQLSGALASILAAIAALRLPALWPGVAHRTLLAPVAISGDHSILGPMHGCLVELTTVGLDKRYWIAGDHTNYRYAGFVAFVSDSGQAEAHQYLEFNQHVYVPRSMVQAQRVLIHCSQGVQGIATPYITT